MKNKILKTLIEEAKNICNIQEAQIKQIIQITEQLTKNNFIVVIFKDNRTSKCMSHTEFKFHPKKTVQEIKKKLFNSNDEMELLLLVRYSSGSMKMDHFRSKMKVIKGHGKWNRPLLERSSALGLQSNFDIIFRLKNKAENTLKSRLIIETETSAIGDQILTDEEYIEVRIIPHFSRV